MCGGGGGVSTSVNDTNLTVTPGMRYSTHHLFKKLVKGCVKKVMGPLDVVPLDMGPIVLNT